LEFPAVAANSRQIRADSGIVLDLRAAAGPGRGMVSGGDTVHGIALIAIVATAAVARTANLQ
jgi:hypothetical protein